MTDPNTIKFTHYNDSELSIRLKTVAGMKHGDKLSVCTLHVQESTWYTSFTRTLHRDNRSDTVKFLDDCLQEVTRTLKTYRSLRRTHKHRVDRSRENLRKDLMGCKKGMENIAKTYSDDSRVKNSIQNYVEKIDTIIEEYYRRHGTTTGSSNSASSVVSLQADDVLP